MIESKTGIAPHLQILKIGFPPTLLPMPENPFTTELEELGLKDEVLLIEQRPDAQSSTGMHRPQMPYQSGNFLALPSFVETASDFTVRSCIHPVFSHYCLQAMSTDGTTGDQPTSSVSHDEDLARALAMSLNEAGPEHPHEEFEAGPIISDALGDGTFIVRRFVDSDNSCLFTAVAYVMEGNRLKGFDLRSVIATVVQSDPYKYNEAFLGRPNAEYCEWIINPQHWGGEIELMILSQYYHRQIAAFDIQTTNCYIYGQDAGFSEQVMLVYDGIHYDALACSPAREASEDMDLTIFNPLSPEGQMITEAAIKLVILTSSYPHLYCALYLGAEVSSDESIHEHVNISTEM